MIRKLTVVLLTGVICLIGVTSVLAVTYNEAPMLKVKVAAGELPPVEERLPDEPFVVGPGVLNSEEWLDWEVGKLGGTVRLSALNQGTLMALVLGTTILRAPDQSTKDPAPAIVSDYTVSDDYKTFTFTIRKGLKWSDGAPVTTEDVRFLFEDIYMDQDIVTKVAGVGDALETGMREIFPVILKAQGIPTGEPGKLEIIDDYTFKIIFNKPYGWFISELASWIPDYTKLFQPSHYLKKFHAKYTPIEEIQPYLEKEGLETWQELVALKEINHWEMSNAPYAVGVPALTPWVPVEIESDHLFWERNPYYWKVDIAGNQLPYFDRVEAYNVSELESVNMKIIAGDIDIEIPSLRDLALYKANEERGNYRVVITGSINNPTLLFLNHDYEYDKEDSAWQKIIGDAEKRGKFGRALALAIDSEDINNNLYFGMYGMPEITPAEFDPEEAGRLLDEIGMNKLDSEGFRLGLDGKKFNFIISAAPLAPDTMPMVELFKEYLEDVGIRTTIDQMGVRLFEEVRVTNQMMASVIWNDGPIWASGISVDYLPIHKGSWAPESWNYYFSQGQFGRKPPEYLQEFFDIHDARKKYPAESKEGEELFQKLQNWFAENWVMIYPLGKVKQPTIVSKRIGNVIKEGYPFQFACAYGMEQLFFKE
ncbi:hypothetical protein ES707_06365 [subsurface metagenome]